MLVREVEHRIDGVPLGQKLFDRGLDGTSACRRGGERVLVAVESGFRLGLVKPEFCRLVWVRRCDEAGVSRLGGGNLLVLDESGERAAVNRQRLCKGRDGREKPLLQSDEGELREGGLLRGEFRESRAAQLAIGRKHSVEGKLGRAERKPLDRDCLDASIRE
jgi:hypothetical protein